MAVLQAADIPDLVASTQRGLGRMKFSQASTRIQRYPAFKQLVREERVKFEDGYEAQWNVLHEEANCARHVGLFAQDTLNIVDGMIQGRAPYRHTVANYGFEKHEVTFNRGAARIYDLVKSRRVMAMTSMAKKIEDTVWSYAASTDNTTPWGLYNYLVYNATTGHNGATPTGWSTVGNINPSTYTRWKNWTAQYTTVSKPDLFSLVRQACRETDFMAPIDSPGYGTGNGYGYYMNGDTLQSVESILEAQNDNLGDSMDPKDGKGLLRRTKLQWVPQLDSGTAATADPFFGINWGEMGFRIPPEWFLVESPAKESPTSHNTMVVYVDLSWALICYDRRSQFAIAKNDFAA